MCIAGQQLDTHNTRFLPLEMRDIPSLISHTNGPAVRKCNIISVGHVRPLASAKIRTSTISELPSHTASEKTPAVNDSISTKRDAAAAGPEMKSRASDKALKKRTKDIRKLSTHS